MSLFGRGTIPRTKFQKGFFSWMIRQGTSNHLADHFSVGYTEGRLSSSGLEVWIQVLIFLTFSCVALGRLLDLSGSPFLHL